jgi:P-type Cu+ transporter
MKTDPICGMTVDEATALHAERDGQTFYFCSEHCRKKFLSQSTPAKTDGDCCGGEKAKPSGASGDCCGGKDEHADHGSHEHKHGAEGTFLLWWENE